MFYLKGLKKSHRISRLLQIMIAIALFIGLDQLWETSLLQGQQLLKSQTEKMARLLVQQTAYGAAPALQLENDEQLQWLAQALVLDPKVMSASIFSEDGVRLSFAQSVIDEELEPDSEELTNILDQYPPYVEAVSQDGNNLGYVEVRLEPKYFFNEIKEAHHINMEQQQMMLLIAGLIGMLLSRALSFKRADFDRRKARVKLRQLLAKKNEKAAAKTAKKQAAEELKQAKKDKSNLASNAESEAVKTTDNEAISTKAEVSGSEQSSPLSKANSNAAEEEKTGNQSPSVLAATVNESKQTLDSSNRANTELTEPAPEKPTVKPRASSAKSEATSKPVEKPKAKPRTKAKPKSSDETKPAANVKPKAPAKPKVKAKPKAEPKDEA